MLITLLLNLSLLSALAFAGSLLYQDRGTGHDQPSPVRRRQQDHLQTLVRVLFASACGVILMLVPLEVQAGIRADLRHVPTALVTLRYGPLWGLVAATPAFALRAAQGGAGVTVALFSALSVILLASVLARLVHVRRLRLRDLWAAPLIFSLNGTPLLLLPGGAALLAPLYLPLLIANTAGLLISVFILRARLHLLQLTRTYRTQAVTDPLTGLHNRRQFERDLDAVRDGDHLLLADIDHFKTVNDRFGHDAGDEVLVQVARALGGAVRHSDGAYRVGGEEFALLLRGAQGGERTAQRCLELVREGTRLPDGSGNVTVSVGIATRTPDQSPADLFRRADEALYEAKMSGRDRAVTAWTDGARQEPAGHASHLQRFTLWRTLRSTLSWLSMDHELRDEDWQDLLAAAVAVVPQAEAGSLNVREGSRFHLRAVQGYDRRLIGMHHSAEGQLAYYAGSPEDWLAGKPRVLRGTQVSEVARSANVLDGQTEQSSVYDDQGRIAEIRASLCLPVAVDGEVVAHLNLESFSNDAAFEMEALSAASEFVAQVAALLRAQRRRRELEALVAVNSALNAAPDAKATTRILTSQVRELLRAEHAAYLEYDVSTDTLRTVSALGSFAERAGFVLARGVGFGWAALEQRAVLHTDDVRTDPRVYRPEGLGNVSMLAAPLLTSGGAPLGVLIVTRPSERPFGGTDGRIAASVALAGANAAERARSLEVLRRTRDDALLTLGIAMEARDLETRGHTERVVRGALALGAAAGLTSSELEALHDGAALHDVGKLSVPDRVLLKPGRLTPQERLEMQQHAELGAQMVARMPLVRPASRLVVRHHHERWDGGGYPDGLRGEDIPRLARIFAVCDVFDALVSARPYKPAWTLGEGLAEIERGAGTQFDPEAVALFLNLARQGALPWTEAAPDSEPAEVQA